MSELDPFDTKNPIDRKWLRELAEAFRLRGREDLAEHADALAKNLESASDIPAESRRELDALFAAIFRAATADPSGPVN